MSAFTSVGLGPFSSPVEVTMDPVLLEGRREHNGVTAEDGGGASQILKEVWFIILMGCLLVVFFILLSIILYTRRQSHGKKDHHISSEWLNLPLFHYFLCHCQRHYLHLFSGKEQNGVGGWVTTDGQVPSSNSDSIRATSIYSAAV